MNARDRRDFFDSFGRCVLCDQMAWGQSEKTTGQAQVVHLRVFHKFDYMKKNGFAWPSANWVLSKTRVIRR